MAPALTTQLACLVVEARRTDIMPQVLSIVQNFQIPSSLAAGLVILATSLLLLQPLGFVLLVALYIAISANIAMSLPAATLWTQNASTARIDQASVITLDTVFRTTPVAAAGNATLISF